MGERALALPRQASPPSLCLLDPSPIKEAMGTATWPAVLNAERRRLEVGGSVSYETIQQLPSHWEQPEIREPS